MQLDEDQAVVAQHNNGPLLVLAGAGSGKTASITGRAARLIQRGIRPDSLLMTTFSKKAASEMKNRLGELVGGDLAAQAMISTFHSLGDKIIKEWPEECGRQQGVSILDESDQRGLFRRLLKEVVGVDSLQQLEYRKWLSAYDRLAQDGCRAVESQHAGRFCQVMQSHAGIERQDQLNWLWRVFGAFEKFKSEQNVVDFNDLLVLPMLALEKSGRMRDAMAMRYPYVTVDEAQDTCIAQYRMIKSFAADHRNLVLVGDDDQSLYGWRGASVNNLKRFINDFQPKIARLERNYRSTAPIVSAAAQHIARNPGRLAKNPYSRREEGEAPVFHSLRTDKDMAHSIVADIKSARSKGTPWNAMAILYRKNRIGELLEPMLLEHNVPYEVYGGTKLTDRREIKIAMAAVRMIINPRDQMAFKLLASGIRGLGDKGLETLFSYAEEHAEGDVTKMADSIRNSSAREETEALFSLLTLLRNRGPSELVPVLLQDWGVERYFPKDTEKQLEVRLERLGVFSEWISTYVEKQAARGLVEDPWRSVMQATIEEPEADLSDNSKVILSTVHRAKGLEWSRVFIAGASDGLMPMRDSQGAIADESEERCTSYVALTRAKDACTLYHCETLDLGYDRIVMAPSPYLEEMGAQPGRTFADPLPLIIKFKEGGTIDMADLVSQKMEQDAQWSSPPGIAVHDSPPAYDEIPGW